MSLLDRISVTHTRRIVSALIVAIVLSFGISEIFNLKLIPYPQIHLKLEDTATHLRSRLVLMVVVLSFLLCHFLLYFRFAQLNGLRLLQFSLTHFFVSMLSASIFVGVNCLAFLGSSGNSGKGSDVINIYSLKTYGFPVQVMVERIAEHVPSNTRDSAHSYSLVGIAINTLCLLLFILNILILRFPSRNPDSLSQRAANDASH